MVDIGGVHRMPLEIIKIPSYLLFEIGG